MDNFDGMAMVRVRPRSDADGFDFVVACWRELQGDPDVEAVAVLSVVDDFSESLPVRAEDVLTIAPKSSSPRAMFASSTRMFRPESRPSICSGRAVHFPKRRSIAWLSCRAK